MEAAADQEINFHLWGSGLERLERCQGSCHRQATATGSAGSHWRGVYDALHGAGVKETVCGNYLLTPLPLCTRGRAVTDVSQSDLSISTDAKCHSE